MSFLYAPHTITFLEAPRQTNFALLGLPSWALVNAIWTSLSQLAEQTPEGYTISAYLIIALTLGNILPLLLARYLKGSQERLRYVIMCLLCVGFVSGVLLSVLWNITMPMQGNRYSVLLYLVLFVAGTCSSASNIALFTYASYFASQETSSLSTGMATGSMIAGLLGLLQGTELYKHGYNLSSYYLTISCLYIFAIYSLYNTSHSDVSSYQPLHSSHRNKFTSYRGILIMQCLNACFGFGVTPAIISSVCYRFNSRAVVLLLATGVACTIDPIFRSFTAYIPLSSTRSLTLASLTLYLSSIALLVTLLLPSSVALFDGAGGTYAVLLYVYSNTIFGFIGTSLYVYLKEIVAQEDLQEATRWTGMVTQFGALVGSIIALCLILAGVI